MRTIRHREVKWYDQDHNTNNEQNQNPDGSLLHTVHLTRTLPRKEPRRHARGRTNHQKDIDPKSKGWHKKVHLFMFKKQVSENFSFLRIHCPLFFFILPLINIPNKLIIKQKKQWIRVFYSIHSI